MTEKKTLRSEPGLRVDQPDFQLVAESASTWTAADAAALHVLNAGYVIRGFVASASGNVVTVTRDEFGVQGSAILGRQSAGGTTYGHIVAAGDAQRSFNVSNLADGTWSIYIRFELRDADIGNRTFWNPDSSAGGPVEVVDNIPARLEANWQVTFALTTAGAPGPEWVLVGQFAAVSGSVSGAVTDTRDLFFEGRPDASYASAWGGGDDRDADRAQHGIKSMRDALRAVHKQLEDVIGATGPTGWWRPVTAGTLMRRDGSVTFNGAILPDTDGTRDLGATATRYQNVFADRLQGRDILLEGPNDTTSLTFGSDLALANLTLINSIPNGATSGTAAAATLAVGGGQGELFINAGLIEIPSTADLAYFPALTRTRVYGAGEAQIIGAGNATLSATGSIGSAQPSITVGSSSGASTSRILVPLTGIPNGALITGAAINCDNPSSLTVTYALSRSIVGNASSYDTMRAGGTPTDSSTGTGDLFFTVDESTAIRTIDRSFYSYVIEISVTPGSGATFTLNDVRVSFTQTTLQPA